jgi:putative intracellular protease/amidase
LYPGVTDKSTAVLVFDGYADWEPAYALTGLRCWGGRAVTTYGYDLGPVVSMGGLRTLPERALADLVPEATDLLILPGGDVWAERYSADQLEPVVARLVAAQVLVAGICGATIALARAGLFRDRRHTSNGREFLLQHAPGYESPERYVDARAVTDRGIISASGLAPAEFAVEIFTTLHAFSDEMIAQFRALYRAD